MGRGIKRSLMANFTPILRPPQGHADLGLGEVEKNWCLVLRRSIHCSHSFEFLA